MPRLLLALALLAAPLAAAAQITHDVIEGVWFIGGTNGPDSVVGDCIGGSVKANGTDPVSGPTPCTDVAALNLELVGDDDAAFFFNLDELGLDPAVPSTFDGGPGDDIFQIDLGGFPGPLDVFLGEPVTGPPVASVGNTSGPLFDVLLPDPTTQFVAVFGDDDDLFTIDLDTPDVLSAVQVFARGGSDTVDASGSEAPLLPLLVFGEAGDDEVLGGRTRMTFLWEPDSGTDRLTSGGGTAGILAIGGDDLLGLHFIRDLLAPDLCGMVDFINGGGVIFEDLDEAFFSVGPGGIDLFAEVDCDPDDSEWDGDSGPDRTLFRGSAGGGNRIEFDFPADQSIFSDGFESGDVASWSTSTDIRLPEGLGAARHGDDRPWDEIDYQDWPSFTDPATSGPSTVIVRGKPDFPVRIDLGPDGTTGFGGAVDTLVVDPQGLPFTDNGSTIRIDGGPAITYTGVELLRIGAPVAADGAPEGDAPTLAAFPSPTTGTATVRLSGARAGAVRVTVVDVLGREVAVLHDGPVAAGTRGWPVAAGRLAPGRYLARAEGAGWTAVGPLVVAR